MSWGDTLLIILKGVENMKKASATVIYDSVSNQIYNLTINHNGEYINLIHYDLNKSPQPYKYETFQGLYETILNFARNNGYYYGRYQAFGSTWYDIQWIDLNNPTIISKYGYKERG